MTDRALCERRLRLHDESRPYVTVTVVESTGSTPADAGAAMLVTKDGLEYGTVGGGRLEAKAIDLAQQLLAEPEGTRLVDWSLKTDVGMTCGGRVKLYLEVAARSDWPVVIFGAGHVAQALARLLAALPCQVTCIDPREDWLARLPAGVMKRCVPSPADEVDRLAANTFVLCMTRGHSSDLPVLDRIYSLPHAFPYVGVIGSNAKAKTIRQELIAAGKEADRLQFSCPVGLPIGTNHPAEIAVSIAAQLLQVRDLLAAR
ncbi:XdhC and CoxI family protein [Posidoniimonas polymericola]|uniref:XdhC and CoxI family protein n=1 Tax=Posidoniimonas polymericola TaxID=2528002 RepID=A0A5C5YMG1_9BACT|nr:xanthine dehydrogenase accessory protein XdhC [Posidoniimonas polymericola]TWT76104.1 XdhC and CoxI family protein [Posidoniimonas polymericola]